MSLGLPQNLCQFVIPIDVTTYAESLVKIGPVVVEVIGYLVECGDFWRIIQKGAVVTLEISGVTGRSW